MKEDHEPGRCYACGQDTEVRWKNLYTIGSEGTWLCMACEIKVVKLLRTMAQNATKAKVRKWIEKKKRLRPSIYERELIL